MNGANQVISLTDEDTFTGRVRRYARVGGPFFSLSPTGGEGWGEGAASTGSAIPTSPSQRSAPGPSLSPLMGGEGSYTGMLTVP